MTLPLLLISVLFCIGYLCIVLEHNIGVDKAGSAVLTGVLCWVVYVVAAPGMIDAASLPADFLAENARLAGPDLVTRWAAEHQLMSSFAETAAILFFLLGAMTIVEVMDAYGCFAIITDRIRSRSMVKLLWIFGFVTFFLSALLDNLTTTIVMVSLARKLIRNREERLFFAGIVVVAANAGGAWSPIGDVTTTMLWIGQRITSANIITTLFLPSAVCLAVPLLWLSLRMRGREILAGPAEHKPQQPQRDLRKRNLIFALGVGGLLFVPVFKVLTHMPPFMGMLLSLGVLWVVSELLRARESDEDAKGARILDILHRIDTASVLFFLGILTAVSALHASGILHMVSAFLERTVGQIDVIVFLIGLLSAVVDNVPLVAGVMGMYDLSVYPTDAATWEFLAYAAGTGGSCLIIGSAAGVAAMGMERINFFWYLRNIAGLALLGYVAGTAAIFLPRLL